MSRREAQNLKNIEQDDKRPNGGFPIQKVEDIDVVPIQDGGQ